MHSLAVFDAGGLPPCRELLQKHFHVAACDTLDQCIGFVALQDAECTLLDFTGLESLEDAVRYVKRAGPRTKVIVCAPVSMAGAIFASLQAGAEGAVVPDCAACSLLQAVRGVLNGNGYLAPKLQSLVSSSHAQHAAAGVCFSPELQPLSQHEIKIFKLIALGYQDTEIAKLLFKDSAAIAAYRSSIYDKLELGSAAQARELADAHGLFKRKKP